MTSPRMSLRPLTLQNGILLSRGSTTSVPRRIGASVLVFASPVTVIVPSVPPGAPTLYRVFASSIVTLRTNVSSGSSTPEGGLFVATPVSNEVTTWSSGTMSGVALIAVGSFAFGPQQSPSPTWLTSRKPSPSVTCVVSATTVPPRITSTWTGVFFG